jgi:hypothetical protein
MRALAHSLLSRRIFRAGRDPDWLVAEIIKLRAFGIPASVLWLYPRMFCADANCGPLPLTAASFTIGRCFVVHCQSRIWIWIGEGISEDWLEAAFGVRSPAALSGVTTPPVLEGNAALRALIEDCCAVSFRYLPVEIILQGDPREAIFASILVDDSRDSGENLTEWLSRPFL